MMTSLGFGLGPRPEHHEAILRGGVGVDWFEVLTENYLVPELTSELDRARELHDLARAA